jgi:hypothetical protein
MLRPFVRLVIHFVSLVLMAVPSVTIQTLTNVLVRAFQAVSSVQKAIQFANLAPMAFMNVTFQTLTHVLVRVFQVVSST